MIDDEPHNPSPSQSSSVKQRAGAWFSRHRIGLAVFALALLFGAVVSMLWVHSHQAQPAPATAGAVGTPDPTHPPLPAPMPGALSTLPPPATPAPGSAYIAKPAPTAPESDAVDAASTPATTAATDNSTSTTVDAASTDGDRDPQVTQRTQPEYPIEAMRAHAEGEVRVQVAVDALGSVEDVRLSHSSGSRVLDRAAMAAVRGWNFRPAQHSGVATSGLAEVTVEFHLDEQH